MAILSQFIFRLSFGLALGMAITSPRQVTSGYYRNHLYVLLGLNVLATMVAAAGSGQFVWPPLLAAIVSYVGAVLWLYEKPRVASRPWRSWPASRSGGAWADTPWQRTTGPLDTLLLALGPPSGGLVLGITIAAMFLGHWYLNTPTMAIGPLEPCHGDGHLRWPAGRGRGRQPWVMDIQATGWPDTEQTIFIAGPGGCPAFFARWPWSR